MPQTYSLREVDNDFAIQGRSVAWNRRELGKLLKGSSECVQLMFSLDTPDAHNEAFLHESPVKDTQRAKRKNDPTTPKRTPSKANRMRVDMPRQTRKALKKLSFTAASAQPDTTIPPIVDPGHESSEGPEEVLTEVPPIEDVVEAPNLAPLNAHLSLATLDVPSEADVIRSLKRKIKGLEQINKEQTTVIRRQERIILKKDTEIEQLRENLAAISVVSPEFSNSSRQRYKSQPESVLTPTDGTPRQRHQSLPQATKTSLESFDESWEKDGRRQNSAVELLFCGMIGDGISQRKTRDVIARVGKFLNMDEETLAKIPGRNYIQKSIYLLMNALSLLYVQECLSKETELLVCSDSTDLTGRSFLGKVLT